MQWKRGSVVQLMRDAYGADIVVESPVALERVGHNDATRIVEGITNGEPIDSSRATGLEPIAKAGHKKSGSSKAEANVSITQPSPFAALAVPFYVANKVKVGDTHIRRLK